MSSLSTSMSRAQLAAVLAIGTVSTTVFLYLRRRRQRLYQYWNSEFVEAGTVDELYLYTIKGCKPRRAEFLDCTSRGSKCGQQSDREFVLMDELHDNKTIAISAYSTLVLVDSAIDDDVLKVSFPNGNTVEVDLKQVVERRDVRHAKFWDNGTSEGFDCGDEIAAAFEDFLEAKGKRRIRMLKFDPSLFSTRLFQAKPNLWLNPVSDFQDPSNFFPDTCYMAMTTASLDNLNDRLKIKGENAVTIRNFRPGLVIKTSIPFDEDKWLHIRIGEVLFVCMKPCSRCVITTVNADTGVMSKTLEPLKTLREFRLAPGKLHAVYGKDPIFGVNISILNPGRISVNDKVYVRYKPTPF